MGAGIDVVAGGLAELGGVADVVPLPAGPALLEVVALAEGVGGLCRIVAIAVVVGPGLAEALVVVVGTSAAEGMGTVAKTGVPPCAA